MEWKRWKTGILHGKISDISGDDQSYFKLSQDSYLMVTDMQHNLTFVPESTAEFLGIPSGWCEDGYKIVLEKSVHPYDCPEYTEEMKNVCGGSIWRTICTSVWEKTKSM